MNVILSTIIKQTLLKLLPKTLVVAVQITIFAVVAININILPLLYFAASSANQN
jgi:hypothetical protein